MTDHDFMQEALLEAKKAEAKGEVPIGAVLVLDGKIIARGHNQPITLKDPSAHAEILAIRAAGQILQNYRLLDTTLYVTLEPCPMCFSALIQARVQRIVFGARTFGEVNHRFMIEGGILEQECADLLQSFFKGKRLKPSDNLE